MLPILFRPGLKNLPHLQSGFVLDTHSLLPQQRRLPMSTCFWTAQHRPLLLQIPLRDNMCHHHRLADEGDLIERRPRYCLSLFVPIEEGSVPDALQVDAQIHERCRSHRMWVEN